MDQTLYGQPVVRIRGLWQWNAAICLHGGVYQVTAKQGRVP